MLVLSRKPGEKVFIGNDVSLVVLKVRGDRVQLGIEAPGHVRIVRQEICDRLAKNAG
ncbi:MAG: carbon storage regulator [Planctomycetia bacterium]|nr:carbon storage regulator [Planctomycetia bacterium]